MTEVHEDYGPGYAFSDHPVCGRISYRVDGHAEHGEILWICAPGTLANDQAIGVRSIVAPDPSHGLVDSMDPGEVVIQP